MSEIAISALGSASTVNDADLTVLVQDGTTLKVTREILLGSASNTTSGGNYKGTIFGYNNTVSKQWNTSVGIYNTASSTYNNSAMGAHNNATGGSASALGYENEASGESSTACGYSNTASGSYASAFGAYNQAMSQWASAVGYFNQTTNTAATAIGWENTASGEGSTACGYDNTASTYQSCAFGAYNHAENGVKNTAIGWENYATGYQSTACGYNNTAAGYYQGDTAIGFRNNTTGLNADGSYVGTVWTGHNTAIGYRNIAAGYYTTTAIGAKNTVRGHYTDYCSAVGYNNLIAANNIENASAFGSSNTASSGGSNAFGYDNTAAGYYASAFGAYNTALGNDSNAFGFRNQATNTESISIGSWNTASGVKSIAAGYNNTASNYYSTSVGTENAVNGSYSTALGFRNQIVPESARSSFAVGHYNTGSGVYGSAVGQYNVALGKWSSAVGSFNFAGYIAWETVSYNIVDGGIPTISVSDPNGYLNQAIDAYRNYNSLPFIQIQGNADNDGAYYVYSNSHSGSVTYLTLYGLDSNANDGTVTAGSPFFNLSDDHSSLAVNNNDSTLYSVVGDATWINVYLIAGIPIYARATSGDTTIWQVTGSVVYDGTYSSINVSGANLNNPSGYLTIFSPVYWQTTQQGRFQVTYDILAVSQEDRQFTVSGDHVGLAGYSYIYIQGSTGNDGIYTISDVFYDGTNTIITVSQTPPDGTADGTFQAGQTITAAPWVPVAMGNNNQATGIFSTSIGSDNTVSGYYAIGFGSDNTASQYCSTAMGLENTASAEYASAFGLRNTASGYRSSVFGYNSSATDLNTSAFGYGTNATAARATALGYQSAASNYDAVSVGRSNTASGYYASALGAENLASGEGSTACGYRNTVASYQSCVFGSYNTASGEEKNTAIGWNNTANDRHCSAVGFSNTTAGNYSNAFGYSNSVEGFNSSAFGYRNTVSGFATDTVAVGSENTATQQYSSAFGVRLQATGWGSTACGYSSTAGGTYATVLGSYNTANGDQSSALGYQNYAPADSASGIGCNNSSLDYRSSAFGFSNTASGYYTSAFGFENTASGESGSAFGLGNNVTGNQSSAFGYNNTASGHNGITVGFENNVTGNRNNVFGHYNTVAGNYNSVCGFYNTAPGTYGVTYGSYNTIGNAAIAVGEVNNALGTRSNAIGEYNLATANQSQAIGMQNIAGPTIWDSGTWNIAATTTNVGPGLTQAAIYVSDPDGTVVTLVQGREAFGINNYIQISGTAVDPNSSIDGIYPIAHMGYGSSQSIIYIEGFLPNNADYVTGTVTTGSDVVDLNLSYTLNAIGSGVGGFYAVDGDATGIQSFLDLGIPVYFHADAGNLQWFQVDHIAEGDGTTVIYSTQSMSGGASGNVRFYTQVLWKTSICNNSFDYVPIAGLATETRFAFSGDWQGYFNNAQYVWVSGDSNDTSNNGVYTVSGLSYNGTYTYVDILETLPNGGESSGYGSVLAGSNVKLAIYRHNAIGHQNTATNVKSSAVGTLNTASGYSSNAFGNNNTASSCYAQVFGAYNVADGNEATALGLGNTASGNYAVAVGYNNTASGENAIAIGHGTTASDYRSIAIGYSCSASYYRNVAIGYNTNATGIWSVSIGQQNVSNSGWTVALGSHNTASGEYATASGYNNTASGYKSSAFGFGNTASNNNTIALGSGNTASNTNSLAVGLNNSSTHIDSIAIGIGNGVSHDYGISVGYNNTAGGTYASAFGYSNTVSYTRGSAFGFENTVSGPFSTAIGYANTASNAYATAIGYGCTASGYYSSAIGGGAISRIENTTNIGGAIIIRKDNDEGSINEVQHFAGTEDVIMSKVVDLTVTQDYSFDVPTNASFFPNECGLIITHAVSVTGQPTIKFGDESALDDLVSAVQTTGLTSFNNRQKFTSLSNDNGHTTLTASITAGATATNFTGRFYWKGMLVEDTVVETPFYSNDGGSYISPIADLTIHNDYPPNCHFYYTTDGSTPNTSSTYYTGGFSVYTSQTITALAVSSRGQWADIGGGQAYNMTVAEPQFDVDSGSYDAAFGLAISCDTGGASIYYTTDGSTPTIGSTLYTGPFTVDVSETVKAYAVLAGANDSDVQSADYTLFCDPPEFSVGGGTFNTEQSLSLSANQPIYYTTDGSDPDNTSTLYTGPIDINASQTIKAVAIQTGWTNSDTITAVYTLVAYDPGFVPSGSDHDNTFTVTLVSVGGTPIYYTTDGSDPDDTSTLYSSPVSVTVSDTTIKAISIAAGWTSSNIISNTYTLTCANPIASPGAGTYSSTQSITLSSDTSGASIYYTTDGSNPTTGSSLYSGAITVSANEAVKAFAHKSNFNDSSIVEFDYVIDNVLPTVTTDSVASHFNGSATVYGTVVSDGSSNLTDYGFVWNTTGSPTLSDNVSSVGSGSFTGSYNQLISGMPYQTIYFAAYATNGAGTSYGSDVSTYVGPCLVKGTKITLADGSKKNIEDVTYDDELLVWNFDESMMDAAKPVWMVTAWEVPEYALVKFSDGSELGTLNDGKGHRIFNVRKSMFTHLMNGDTPVGTTTFNENGEIPWVISMETVKEPTTLYNIITDKHINVFANGILTSTGLNNIYPMVDMKFVKDERMASWSKEDFVGVSDEIFNGLRLAEQPLNYPGLVNKINRLVEKKL